MVTSLLPDHLPMQDFCELCGRDGLTLAYAPVHSHRGISVYVCCYCGLVQSLPRIDHEPRATASDTVRLGKSVCYPVTLAALKRHASSDHFRLIDVGSHRSDFLAALAEAFPAAEAVAVEPDARVAASAAGKAELHVARIESLKFAAGTFDVVHSCHTIEHLAHPLRVLKDHARILKDGGVLLLDAPNIALTGADDIIEEWFVDKHLYHFSARTLTRMVEAAGFAIVEQPDPNDRENLFLVAKKTGTPHAVDPDPNEVDRAVERVSTYAATRSHNADALPAIAEELTAMAPRGVAIWGAGRIFDTVVLYGGFDPKKLAALVDPRLAHIGERHGVKLSTPEALAAMVPGVVVVLTRYNTKEIAAEAKTLVPGAEIIAFAELLERARLKRAA
jgi:ubiquinone/menaquinone biosynthesis C-methylase UbiE